MKFVVNARFLTQPITGVQRFAIEISKILKQNLKGEILFAAPKGIIHDEIAQELDVRVVGSTQSYFWEQIDLYRFLKKNNSPILINLCNTAPLLYNKNVVTIHDLAFEVFPQTYSKSFLHIYKYLIPRIAHRARKIITVSEFSKSEIVKYYGVPEAKIEVIHNAVNSSFHYVEDIRLKEKKYFLTVSSLNYRKNLKLVLNAFNTLNNKEKNIKLYVVGDIDSRSFSKYNLNDFKTNQNIVFLGRLSDEDLMKYYSNSIAFIYPSLYEGFGIPPLEAQFCNSAAIVSDIECFHEIFQDSVIFTNILDSQDLVKNMQLFFDDNFKDNFIIKGMKNKNKYNWERSGEKLLRLLEKMK